MILIHPLVYLTLKEWAVGKRYAQKNYLRSIYKLCMKKGWQVALLIIGILLADQALKFYIKTHYFLGEEHNVLGSFFRLHFVENPGMAWGWKFGGDWGKIILTLFRLVAVILGIFYLRNIIRSKYHPGFITCAALIFAGAAGNLIDSMFYGMIFNNSDYFTRNIAVFVSQRRWLCRFFAWTGGRYVVFPHYSISISIVVSGLGR